MSNDSYFDNSFYKLASEVTKAIQDNEDGTIQQEQVEKLMELEDKFKKSILKYKTQSREIYKKFILMVVVQNKNILSARPYFREKATTFSSRITPAIREGNIEALKEFHMNYQLIKFIKENWKGQLPERSEKLFHQITEARRKLIENNMPLAINRAKLFYRKVPKSHLTLMDMIGIAAHGLISGIDKWVGKYSKVFRSVCIGRMSGNMVDSYSETTIHFYPSDRHILYRANSLRYRHNIEDLNVLVAAINESFVTDEEEGKKTPKSKITIDELASLMSAASTVSADSPAGSEETGPTVYDSYSENLADEDMEESIIRKQATEKMLESIKKLAFIDQKVLRLKGVRF